MKKKDVMKDAYYKTIEMMKGKSAIFELPANLIKEEDEKSDGSESIHLDDRQIEAYNALEEGDLDGYKQIQINI